ncbi:hypothetical protein H2204_008335 [Knufia peltigerae]|uniref:Cytochrome P450 n=1 Tax=Knufia peltigerae TaxID=1002370 RepID=A0AA39CWY7_9EURO|nr:hypothetical protein H2204_008335 [Knufia peltigerae]
MGNSEAGHARLRRAFIGAFSDTATKEVHAPVIEKYVHLWIGQFKAMIEKNGKENGGTSAEPAETWTNTTATVDMISWLNFLTFDISGDLSFGESFGSTARGEPHAWVDIANGYGKGIALIASLNYFVAPLQKLLRFVMPASVRRKMAYHQNWTAQKVRKRLEFKKDRADFMGAVLKYNNQPVKTKEEKVSIQELELNMATFIFAGSETTSSALAVVLFELLKAPDILKRVQDEVRSAFEREKDIDVARCSKLEYLSAVINEGIRIGPPSVIGVPRVVKGHGEEVCGKWVPGGTYLAVNQYAAFHATANFTDPSKFQPERFLTPDADAKTSNDNLAVFQPFLVGRHTCIGQKFAWAEMRLVLARLLFAFDISRAETNSATVNVGDWGEQKTFIFWEKEPLHVSLKKRVS